MVELYQNYKNHFGLNVRYVCWVMGILCMVQVAFLLISLGISAYYNFDRGANEIGLAVIVGFILGGSLMLFGRKKSSSPIGRREGMLTVSLSWLIVGVIGMIPFYFGGYTQTLAAAFFETISGLTTTGGTVFADVESLPKSILFWRAFLQWQGGIGIIVAMVAFIPIGGESAAMVYNSETSGITHERFVPRIGVMAKWIMYIYFGLSLLNFLFLWAGPMGAFDAVCHMFSCIATGGFSTWNNSLEHYHDTYTNIVLVVFMLLGATNFTLYYFAITKKSLKHFLMDTEFKWFMMEFVALSSIAVLWLFLSGLFPNFGEALERGVVNIVSLMTTTGYSYGDYSTWGGTMDYLVLVAMFVAGCTGSTSGGLKSIRVAVLVKSLSNQIRSIVHPQAVIPVRVNGHALSEQVTSRVMTFFFAYLSIIIIGLISVTLQGFELNESLSVVVASLSNSGGGLGKFGPFFGVSALNDFNLILMSIIMVMGRLEIFTLLVLFHRNFWRN